MFSAIAEQDILSMSSTGSRKASQKSATGLETLYGGVLMSPPPEVNPDMTDRNVAFTCLKTRDNFSLFEKPQPTNIPSEDK